MVIDDLDIERIAAFETEAHAPLVIDTDAPLASTGVLQGLQLIRRGQAQVFDSRRNVQLRKPHSGASPNGCGKTA
jgi:hypothetical protein